MPLVKNSKNTVFFNISCSKRTALTVRVTLFDSPPYNIIFVKKKETEEPDWIFAGFFFVIGVELLGFA